ncbi:MAG: cyclic nucleotide-binding domain-containing protein [Actinobacteria bacterium]|jgi:CRP/FNR family transcriptional regulator, cyclic AMP receptor protein|nr:MAG: cyclic nucleotide-binding domain-containing protein [Actinomycetota bacterium]
MTTVRGVFLNARTTKDFAAGDTIFLEGEVGDCMYGVVSGQVELKHGANTVGTVDEGDVFGEMAIIDKSPRALSAIAAKDCSLAVIDQREFLFLVHETPTFALEVMSSLAERLRRLNTQS